MSDERPLVQRIATGTTVETFSDAMSSRTSIRVVIPQAGPCVTPEQFSAILETHLGRGHPRLSDVEAELRQVAPATAEAKRDLLAQEAYLIHAQNLFHRLNDLTRDLPPDFAKTVHQALDLAFGIGVVTTTAELRQRNLPTVRRGKKANDDLEDARKRRSKEQIHPDDLDRFKRMDRLIFDSAKTGKKRLSEHKAAREVLYPGIHAIPASAEGRRVKAECDALRNRYRNYRGKKMGGGS